MPCILNFKELSTNTLECSRNTALKFVHLKVCSSPSVPVLCGFIKQRFRAA